VPKPKLELGFDTLRGMIRNGALSLESLDQASPKTSERMDVDVKVVYGAGAGTSPVAGNTEADRVLAPQMRSEEDVNV
jgi:hypothetical protein